jgi:hypothetical protein
VSKLEPAPLSYPNGGGLKAMADASQASLEEKLQAHDLASSIKRKQIIESHNKKSVIKPIGKARKVTAKVKGPDLSKYPGTN